MVSFSPRRTEARLSAVVSSSCVIYVSSLRESGMSKSYEQAKPVCKVAPKLSPVHEWAAEGVAAMLARVRAVCITEYQWMIDELRRG